MRYSSSPSGRFVAADDDLARLLGYGSAQELIDAVGDIATEFYVDPSQRALALDALARHGRLDRFVAPVKRKDGGVVWLAEHARARRTSDGATVFEGVLADVTPLHHELEALRECCVGFRELVDRTTAGAAVAIEGRLRYANLALARRLGATPQALHGVALAELIELDDPAVLAGDATVEVAGRLRPRSGGAPQPVRVVLGAVPHGAGHARLLTILDEAASDLSVNGAMFERSVVGMYQSTPDGGFLAVNPAFAALLGYPSPAALLREVAHVRDLYADPDERPRVLARLDSAGRADQLELRLRRRDGSLIWVMESARAVRGDDGRVLHYEGVMHDVTARRAIQDALLRSEARYRALVEDSQVGVFLSDQGRIVYANRALATMLGCAEDHLIGRHFREVYAPEAVAAAELRFAARARGAEGPQHVAATLLHGDGHTRISASITVATLDVDGRPLEAGTVIDVSEQKRVERQLRHLATHDPLTTLPNRTHLIERLGRVMRDRREGAGGYAVLFVDLDGFKIVNDSLGHASGDLLLAEIARRLRHCVRPGDTLARHGGDEFTVLVEQIASPTQAVVVAQRILDELRLPFRLGDRELFASASIGIAFGQPHYQDPLEPLRDADNAMYRAKASGSGSWAMFDAAMHEHATQRLQLETDLRTALERDELRCHLQPVVDHRGGRIAGFEALLRWQHPTRGLLAPGAFLDVAEETGLIEPMGWWIMGAATRALAGIRRAHPSLARATVSVNLAQRQLLAADLGARVARVLQDAGLAAEALRLEITETVLMESAIAARGALDELAGLGVRLDLDDFGTGHSSLSYVGTVPVHGLKVDRSFLAGVPGDARRESLLRTIVQLARNLDLELTVEGVERPEQVRRLAALGYRRMQGYHFGRPAAPELAALDAAALRFSPRAWLSRLWPDD